MGFLAVFLLDFPLDPEAVDSLRGKLPGRREAVTYRVEEILGDDADPVMMLKAL